MGKALIAVGTFLSLCLVIFGGVVYFTRDENTYAVDAQLSESISKEIAQAEGGRDPVDLRIVAGFDFDRVLIFTPGTPKRQVDSALGFTFMGELRYTAESSEILVFTNHGKFVRFADYRGRAHFGDLTRPLDYLPANDAVFKVKNAVVTRA